MKKSLCYTLVPLFFITILITSCLTPTGQIYEEKITPDSINLAEDGKIFLSLRGANYLSYDTNLLYINTTITLDNAKSKTILGNYKSNTSLSAKILSFNYESKSAYHSEILMSGDAYCSNESSSTYSIGDSSVIINGKSFKTIGETYEAYTENTFSTPIYTLADSFFITKCRCLEYKDKKGNIEYCPTIYDIYEDYQLFQLFMKNEDNKNELLAEWDSDTYQIYKNAEITVLEIKEIMSAFITRIEWEKLFSRDDLSSLGKQQGFYIKF